MPRKRKNPPAEGVPDLAPEVSTWPMIFGGRFRDARLANGFSLREVERLTGITDTELLKMENGSYECRLSSFIKLCGALGIPPGRMLDDTITGSFAFYSKAILRDRQSVEILRDLNVTEDDSVLFNLGSCCAFAADLLRTAFAHRVASRVKYPTEELREQYLRFAQTVDRIEERLERLSVLDALRLHPVLELQRQRIFNEAYVRKLHAESKTAMEHNQGLNPPNASSGEAFLKLWRRGKRGPPIWLPLPEINR